MPKKARRKGKGPPKRSSPDTIREQLEAIIIEQSTNIKKFDYTMFQDTFLYTSYFRKRLLISQTFPGLGPNEPLADQLRSRTLNKIKYKQKEVLDKAEVSSIRESFIDTSYTTQDQARYIY